MIKRDYITALFTGGVFYWLMCEEATADVCWRTAVDILSMSCELVGEA